MDKVKQWTDQEIEEALIEAGYTWKPVTWNPRKPFKTIEETNKLNRQYYRWVQTDSDGNIVWAGNKYEAAKRANLFSFAVY